MGGFELHDTVSKVKTSDARSARLCQASATMARELKAHPPMNLAMAMPKLDKRPKRVMRTPGSLVFAEVRYVLS